MADLPNARRQGLHHHLPLQGGPRARRRTRKGPEPNRGPKNDARRAANRYVKRVHYGNCSTKPHGPRFLDNTQINSADWMLEVMFDYGDHDMAVPKPNDDQAKDAAGRSTHRPGTRRMVKSV